MPNSQVLTGKVLQSALAVTVALIPLLDHTNRPVREMTADEAAFLLASGHVEAVGRRNRVRYLRALNPSAFRVRMPDAGWAKCWRTAEAAVLWEYEAA